MFFFESFIYRLPRRTFFFWNLLRMTDGDLHHKKSCVKNQHPKIIFLAGGENIPS